MSCIVGIEHSGGVTIGGDSAAVDGSSISARRDPKVFTNRAYLIGFSGSYRVGQLLRYSFTPPAPPARGLDRFMSTLFVDALRETLREGGALVTDPEIGETVDGCSLVATRGRLFMVDADFQIGRQITGYDALGEGHQLALGSLHTTQRFDIAPHDRVVYALQATAAYSTGVTAPFHIRTQPR